ncbi:hypothetical protein R1flu_024830 [Riccia fluitans]|uniref:Uncharacterized protein n=1 Tax=Riccia fluitans TaxID=41844 RepID=A0ABD1Y043_9MARC
MRKELHDLRVRFDGMLIEPFDLMELEKPKRVRRAKKNIFGDDPSPKPPTSKVGWKQECQEDSSGHIPKAEAPKSTVSHMDAGGSILWSNLGRATKCERSSKKDRQGKG